MPKLAAVRPIEVKTIILPESLASFINRRDREEKLARKVMRHYHALNQAQYALERSLTEWNAYVETGELPRDDD